MWYKVCCFLFKKKVIEARGCEATGIIVVYEVTIILKVVNLSNVLRRGIVPLDSKYNTQLLLEAIY